MKLSKQAKRLLNRFIKNGGSLKLNEYSNAYLNVGELRDAGLVEKNTNVFWTYDLRQYEHLYELTTPDIIDDEDDVEYFLYLIKGSKKSCK